MKRDDATLADVAALAGVSLATASKSLSGAADVATGTRLRVREAAGRLGYTRPGHRPRIQVAADTLGNPYTPFVLQGLLDAAKELGIDVAIALSHGRRQPHEPGSAGWITDAADAGFAGVVVITLPVGAEHARAAASRGVSVVAIDPVSPAPTTVTTVRSSNEQGGYDATSHLLRLGHTRIAAVLGMESSAPSVQRLDGYHAALREAGLQPDPELVRSGDFRYEGGLVAGNDLLRMDHPPTAVFAHNDHMAMGVMEAARRLGMRIPDDLSIVGFDDVEWARWSTPPLTTVRQPLEDIGAEAIHMIDAELRGVPFQRGRLDTQLIVRGSTSMLTRRPPGPGRGRVRPGS